MKPEAPKRLMMNCPNCWHSIANNGHFVPPSFRDAGFYACESVCDRCVAAQPTPPQVDPCTAELKRQYAEKVEFAKNYAEGLQSEVTRLTAENQRLTRELAHATSCMDRSCKICNAKLTELASGAPQGETKS